MRVKTLKLSLGNIKPLEAGALTPPAPSGWYVNPSTGKEVYWDAATQKFYTLVEGLFVPLGFTTWPGTVLSVGPGDTVVFTVTFSYSGPALSGLTLSCQIGSISADLIFNELAHYEKTISLSECSTPTPQTQTASVALPSTGVNADWTAVKAQLTGGSPQAVGDNEVTYQNALSIVGVTPVISGFNITNVQKAS